MTNRSTASFSEQFRAYRRAIWETVATGQAAEHSYRPALNVLVEGLGGDHVRAVSESSHVFCGAPDFVVERRGMPIGHTECKDVGTNPDRAETEDQLNRYRSGLPNLILTDYLEFRWYAEGELRESTRLVRLDSQDKILADRDAYEVRAS